MLHSLQQRQWASVCEPDFSVWTDAPLAEQLHEIYRTRWVGRYWQEHGIKVIPTLTWAEEESFEFAWAGVPVGAPVVAIECQHGRSNLPAFNRGIAAAIEAVKPGCVLVYGSPMQGRYIYAERVVYYEPFVVGMRGRLRGRN